MMIYLQTSSVLLIFMTAVFCLALFLRDNSIVDISYGLAFVLCGWLGYFAFGSDHPRQCLVLGMISIWGLRLAVHILLRKRGEQGEDFRYRKWREEWGKSFFWRSYLQIYLLQGGVIYLVALPLLLVIDQPGDRLGLLDLCGALIWLAGWLFETIGDWQLLQFKRNPANRGKIIQAGLWRYTRHPNYFGEALLWWGVFLVALGSPHGLVALLSPLLINFLLLKISGIPMLEAKYGGHPEFEAYKRRTNAFFPWFPRTSAGAPR